MSDNYFVGKLEKLGIGKIYRLEFFHLNVINFLLFVNNFSFVTPQAHVSLLKTDIKHG